MADEPTEDIIYLMCNGETIGNNIKGIRLKNEKHYNKRSDSGTIPKTSIFEKNINDDVMNLIYNLTFVIECSIFKYEIENVYLYEGSFERLGDGVYPLITKITHDLTTIDHSCEWATTYHDDIIISELIEDEWIENYLGFGNPPYRINVNDELLTEILDKYSDDLSTLICWYLETQLNSS